MCDPILDVLRAIRDFIFNADAEAAKPLNATINSFESLIDAATEKQSTSSEAQGNKDNALREGVMQGQPKFSLAGTEVGFILENYDNIQDIATAVEAVVKRYPNETGMLANALSDYRQNANDDEFIQGLRTFAKYLGDKQERDRSEDKATIEETFGGIWIEDNEEFAKFVSAVNTYPTDENGEGIAKTSDYLYLYYRGIGERIIPFASVYLNKGESQNIANELINAWNNGEKETVREWIDWLDESYRNVNVQGNVLSGRDEGVPITGENGGVDNNLSRKGRYYYAPEFYSKVKRADSGSRGRGKVAYSLTTPEMDASYLDAVERGDMETAQRMVMEAAKLAMPNTKVVDEDGNPKAVYHGDRKKARYIFSTDTFFTPDAKYAKRYTNSTGEVYATYLDIKKPFDIRDKKAYDIFTEFRGGRKPVATTTGAMDWGEYSYEDLQEYVEEVSPNEYDGFILDEGADPDGNGGVVHRGLSYVPFTPNQIKSADPVTYDDAGNVIPLSERFNPKKEDVRYALREETMPFFDEGASEEAEGIEPQRGVITTEEQVRIYLRHKHLKAKQNIRKKYRTLIEVSYIDYNICSMEIICWCVAQLLLESVGEKDESYDY